MYRILFLLFLFSVTSQMTQAQKKYRDADRCADIDRGAPIQNIYVDENNNKWVSDFKGLYLAQSPDHAKFLTIPDDEWSLLNMKDGNAELNVPKAELAKLMGDAFEDINTAAFDAKTQTLYIGTTEYGVYLFKVKPTLSLISELDTGNSKLKSDYINTIFIEKNGTIWIGTESGVLTGTSGNWKLYEKDYDILSITRNEYAVFLLGDGETIIELDSRGKGYLVEIEERYIDGEIKDIAVDSKGKIWVASEIIVGYDAATESYEEFGPAENFTSQYTTYLAIDKDDALWVGTEDKGVYFIGASSSFSVSLVVDKALSCTPNAKDAALEVRANGGNPPYNYKWSAPSLSGDQPKNVGAGTYTVTVTDSKGTAKTAEVLIEDPQMSVNIVQDRVASFGGNADGSATLSVSGGTPGYTYQWDNGETAATAQKLTAGKHSVTVSDKTGCSTSVNIEISEGLAALAATITQTKPINCEGEQTAALSAAVSGGEAPYTYTWNKSSDKTAEIDNLAAGLYELTVKDAAGGSITANINIEEPQPLSAKIAIQSAATTNNADGKAKVEVTGGTGNYTYKWDTGETTENSTQLAAGVHSITVTDSNGCTARASIDITEDILPLSATINQTSDIKCAGEQSAAIEITPNGGKPPFQYQWSDAALKGNQAEGLKAGFYQVTVTDASGNSTGATITLNEPTSITLNVSAKSAANLGQEDGKAIAKAKGGTGKYSFKWSNGETSDKAEKLGAGTHDVTVTDENSCSTVASVEIGEDVQALSVNLEQVKEIACAGETSAALVVEISGGKPPFQYQWTNDLNGDSPQNLGAGDYAVTVTDAANNVSEATFSVEAPKTLTANVNVKAAATTNNSDGKATAKADGGTGKYSYQWDTGETTETAEKLGAGTHSVTITDEKGCSTVASVEIGEDIQALSVNLEEVKEIACAGETSAALKVEISGGKPPFQYQWTNDLSGDSPQNLGAGDYAVTVTDAADNVSEATFSIKAPKTLTASVNVKAAATTNNSDGKATAKADGGTGKYSYKWDTGETTETAEKLGAGTHSVTITDEKGCTTTASVEITEDILPLTLSLDQTKENKCFEDKSAALTIQVAGGKPPFQFQWNNPAAKGEKPDNLAAGTYILTVTDAAGTTQTAEAIIPEVAALSADITVNNPASTGNADGKATAVAKGGTGEFSYKWDNGETTAKATKLSPGEHTLTVTDANGCTTTATTSISENILELSVSIQQTTENKCFGEQNAAIEVAVNGGKGPFEYTWNQDNFTGNTASGLGDGTYTVKVKDSKGTEQSASIEVKTPAALTVELLKNKPATNEDSKDGRAEVKVEGGTSPYTYNWDNEETGAINAKLPFGAHQVTVTDANGCTENLSFETGKKIMPALTASRLRAGQTLKLEKLYFPADSVKMTAESIPVVEEIYGFLEDNPKIVIEIGGHTNGVPPHEYCDRISTARAKNVADFIVAKGIDPNRVVYKGYGKRKPLMTNKTETGRKRNQRVEVKILDLGQ